MYCVFYYVHKLSKYKKQFVYIIKEFVLHTVSPTTQRQFVYIIRVCVCVLSHILHYNDHKVSNYK